MRLDLGLAPQTTLMPQRRRRLSAPRDPCGPRLQLRAHPRRPPLTLRAGTEDDVCSLLDVLAGMVRIDHPSPLQGAPGTARVGHLLQDALIIITGGLPVIGARDQAQPIAIDRAEDSLEQRGELGRQGALPRLRHVAQRHRPDTFPTAVQHGDGRCGSLLPSLMLEGYNDAVAPHRQRGPLSSLGCTRRLHPVHHVLDLREVAVGRHARA